MFPCHTPRCAFSRIPDSAQDPRFARQVLLYRLFNEETKITSASGSLQKLWHAKQLYGCRLDEAWFWKSLLLDKPPSLSTNLCARAEGSEQRHSFRDPWVQCESIWTTSQCYNNQAVAREDPFMHKGHARIQANKAAIWFEASHEEKKAKQKNRWWSREKATERERWPCCKVSSLSDQDSSWKRTEHAVAWGRGQWSMYTGRCFCRSLRFWRELFIRQQQWSRGFGLGSSISDTGDSSRAVTSWKGLPDAWRPSSPPGRLGTFWKPF